MKQGKGKRGNQIFKSAPIFSILFDIFFKKKTTNRCLPRQSVKMVLNGMVLEYRDAFKYYNKKKGQKAKKEVQGTLRGSVGSNT